ncbi:MAG: amino acid permease [Candidatus Gastranaerophilales bacterium]|nr:amino acid permease [Candidatus Gastranaerophilales bacterium]
MSNDLRRTLSLQDSISMVAGNMIGCGIFLVSAETARIVQSSWMLLIVWLTAGLVSLIGALAYGELAANITEEGGQYMYLKKIYNDLTAFSYGWTLFLVIQTGSIAAICLAFAKFLGILVPFISSTHILFSIGAFHLSSVQVIAMFICIMLTYINSRGVEYGVLTQNLFTVTKILSLIAIVVCGIFFGMNWDVIHANFPHGCTQMHLGDLRTIATATVGALFAAITWNNLTFIAGEIKEPEKNIPRAMVYGVGLVVILYLLINAVYVYTIPLDAIQNAHEDIVASAVMGAMFGKVGEAIIAVILMISAFGCANGMIMTGSRVYYKMAKDRLFFRGLAAINRHTKVPVNSLWMQGMWICCLVLFVGDYNLLLDFVIYINLIFYAITTFGIFVYRRKFADEPKILTVNNFFPITFISAITFIVGCLTLDKPTSTLPGLLITLAGFPVYYFWSRAKNKKTKVLNKNKQDAIIVNK